MTDFVRDLTEEELIALLTTATPAPGSNTLGVGDDAAVLARPSSALALTCDMAVEGEDFRKKWSNPGDFGWKVVVQNVADCWAMGAKPTGLLLALAMPADTPVKWVQDFAQGFSFACQAYGVTLVGGDLSAAPQIITSITAYGEVIDKPITRSGARTGDDVFITGPVGLSQLGLDMLRDADEQGESLEYVEMTAAVGTHRRPAPPLSSDGPRAAEIAHAMIDISDGLVRDLRRVAAASDAHIDLTDARMTALTKRLAHSTQGIPDEALRDAILSSGEEHVLALTVPAGTPLPDGWFHVGVVTDSGDAGAVTLAGQPLDVSGGFSHFS